MGEVGLPGARDGYSMQLAVVGWMRERHLG